MKPLNLQLDSHALRQSNLLPGLLHCMSLAELIDPAKVKGGKFKLVWDLFCVSNTKRLYKSIIRHKKTVQEHTDINKVTVCANRFVDASY